jgi:hypothetical protein
MSTENYKGYKFRYVHDNESRGKVKVYVEEGASSGTQHTYKGENGSPPYICFKEKSKPSSYSDARSKARKWANMNRR